MPLTIEGSVTHSTCSDSWPQFSFLENGKHNPFPWDALQVSAQALIIPSLAEVQSIVIVIIIVVVISMQIHPHFC